MKRKIRKKGPVDVHVLLLIRRIQSSLSTLFIWRKQRWHDSLLKITGTTRKRTHAQNK